MERNAIARKSEEKLKAIKLDYWSRNWCIKRTGRVRNETTGEQMAVTVNILDTIKGRSLKWYRHQRGVRNNG